MDIITINNIKYIDGAELINCALEYSKHCRSSRNLITKHNIDDSNYIFAKLKNNNWIITKGKSVKMDKVLFKYEYLETIPEINNILNNKYILEDLPEEIDDEKLTNDLFNNLTIRQDNNNKVYFNILEINKLVDDEDLENKILNDNLFKYNIDYKYFKVGTTKKELYLTYEGMLKVIFNSENNKTKGFVKWATETLFTVQMGDEEDKDSLAASLLGTTYKVIKQVFRCSSKTTPCIYLLVVKEEGDKIICKYGFSKDLVRRMKEHKTLFKKEFGKEPTLLYYSIIDIKHMSEAENDISGYFCNNKYEYGSMEELVIINKSDLNQVKMVYQCIENKYIGRYEEIKNEVNELKLEIVELNNKLKNSVTDHNHELEILNKKHNHELQMLKNKNDSELQMLKNKYDSEMEMLKNKNELELYKKDIEIKSLKDKHLIEMQQKDIDILKKEVDILRKYK